MNFKNTCTIFWMENREGQFVSKELATLTTNTPTFLVKRRTYCISTVWISSVTFYEDRLDGYPQCFSEYLSPRRFAERRGGPRPAADGRPALRLRAEKSGPRRPTIQSCALVAPASVWSCARCLCPVCSSSHFQLIIFNPLAGRGLFAGEKRPRAPRKAISSADRRLGYVCLRGGAVVKSLVVTFFGFLEPSDVDFFPPWMCRSWTRGRSSMTTRRLMVGAKR